jgi:hypothetical protein
MRNQCLRLSLATATLLSGWSAQAFGTDVSLDWKVRNVYVTPSPTFEGPVTIGCPWRATVDHAFQWKQTIQWSGMFLVDGKDAGSFTVSYPPNNQNYMPPHKQDSSVTNIYGVNYDYGGTASNQFNGTRERTVNLAAGSHKVGCAIALVGETGESSKHKKNNTKQITIEVQPLKQLAPAEFPSYKPPSTGRISGRDKAPQVAVKNVSLPRPKLTVSVINQGIDASCKDPYNIAKINLSVHADLPLGANRGWVEAFEPQGGLSGKVELPAIGAGSSVLITVALATAVPPSTLVGHHFVVIQLQPKKAGGQPAFDPPTGVTSATLDFPAGYCPSAKMVPPPQGGRRLQPAAPKTTPPARRPG